MNAPLRAGIIGTGFMGAVHAEAVRAAGHTVVGFAGSHPDKAQTMANKNGGVGFASVEALIVSDEVDIVHVCTPNHLHRDHAMPALHAGKHVVCEKPLATTAQDAKHLCPKLLARTAKALSPSCIGSTRRCKKCGTVSPRVTPAPSTSFTGPTCKIGSPLPPPVTGG